MKIISKITLFIIVLVSFGVLNAWIINGPLLEHNSQMSMNQFQGVQQTDVIPGFGVTFNTIYMSSEPKAPTSLDVAPPPLAVQPFRVGDEGDGLKIASKLSLLKAE